MRKLHSGLRVQLDLLRTFLAIIEEGSLNRAATRLHVSQSSLTRRVATLEHEADAQLFERTSRGVALTAAGQALAADIRQPLEAVEQAMARARRISRGDRTELRVGYLQAMAHSYLNPALATLRASHPDLRVSLLDMCAGSQMRALRNGAIDVGLIGPEGALLAREFYTRKVRTLPVVVALPADHPLAARTALQLADLRTETFLAKNDQESPGYCQWIVRLCRGAHFRPRFGPVGDGTSHMLSLVVSEGAVALFPEFVRDQPAGPVVFRTLSTPAARWDFLVVWQRGRIAAPLRAFLDALLSASSPLPALKSA